MPVQAQMPKNGQGEKGGEEREEKIRQKFFYKPETRSSCKVFTPNPSPDPDLEILLEVNLSLQNLQRMGPGYINPQANTGYTCPVAF